MTDHRSRILSAVGDFYAKHRDDPLPTVSKRTPKRTNDTPTEYQEQMVLCDWLLARKVYYFAVPNGGSRSSAIEGARLRRIGVKPGVPDIVIVKPAPLRPAARGVAIELKRTKGGKASEHQAYWLELLKTNGWECKVAYGASDAIGWLEGLGY